MSALLKAKRPGLHSNPPAVGKPWIGQGGYYAGIIRDASTGLQWHLVLVAHPPFSGPWGSMGKHIPGDFSRVDGAANTALILRHDPANLIANLVSQLCADGHRDCYWPAQGENNLICTNLANLTRHSWHWSSTQCGRRSAWSQNYRDGHTSLSTKGGSLLTCAVRRVPIITPAIH